MDLFFDCPCGRRTAVSPAQAGSALACHCGRTNVLPGLSELRRLAGKAEYEAGLPHLIRRQVEDGELPGRDCLLCGQPTDALVIARAECEQEFVRTNERSIVLLILLGILLSARLMVRAMRSESKVTEGRGRDVTVTLPLRVCADCRSSVMAGGLVRLLGLLTIAGLFAGVVLLLWRPILGVGCLTAATFAWFADALLRRWQGRALRAVVLREPLYARLLDEYPHAALRVVAAAKDVPMSEAPRKG